MAAPAPSPLLERLANVWRHLCLRSDIDDIVLELLGRFSLEKVYMGASNREAYQQQVMSLLARLNAIFYLQRLTIPAENAHVGWYLGYLVSWEVSARSVEFILQTIIEGREVLWECSALRDKYLAECLLSALRVLTLHPKAPSNQRAKDRRDRFARIHRSLEQLFDSYPGPKSFLLEVCKEVTSQLHIDSNALDLPSRLKYELPNLTLELYPRPESLTPPSIAELVPQDDIGAGWLTQFLALRDVSLFLVGASLPYAANHESGDAGFQSSCANCRNTILVALNNLRLPAHLSRMDMVSTFSDTFRLILPDTPDLMHWDAPEHSSDEYTTDALEAFSLKLSDRQVLHRVSDREVMQNISHGLRLLRQDDPNSQLSGARPGLYVTNCPWCHLIGESQLRTAGVQLQGDHVDGAEIQLPLQSRCFECGEPVTMIREVPLVKQMWQLLQPLEVSAEGVNVERHLPSQFQLGPPKLEIGGAISAGYSNLAGPGERHDSLASSDPATIERGRSMSQSLVSPQSPEMHPPRGGSLGAELWRSDSSTYHGSRVLDDVPEAPHSQQDQNGGQSTRPPLSNNPSSTRRSSIPQAELLSTPVAPSKHAAAMSERGKSKWRLNFSAKGKSSTGASGDSSSLSESTLEAQRLEEIPLGALLNSQKSSSRSKAAKNIKVYLSQHSTLALLWTHQMVHAWDVGTSPPAMKRAISTESTCILAAVAKQYLAYIIGTRDQKLTLRIIDLVQASAPVIEYRMPSSPWCRSIAIDRKENYVVVGFENAVVRFFKTTRTEQPKEDRLHALYHRDCKGCPSVETLSFSNDGLFLVASTRSPKNGLIQIYCWQFPFLTFQELAPCRYFVPLHESEDNGISSAIFRSGAGAESNVVCITTWTQSGTPLLVQPNDGHKSEVKSDINTRHSKLGNRIQCAAFSISGRELAMVNDKGYLFQISNLDSSPMDIKKLATSKELTSKTESFAMTYMQLQEDEHIVLAWADIAKNVARIRKIPTASQGHMGVPPTSTMLYTGEPNIGETLPAELDALGLPVELPTTMQRSVVMDRKVPRTRIIGPDPLDQKS
ncbi:hypothetical protein BX600DRAFT_508720 [Xylariales sp. PMI_506]|nr:hypothetical protein BX600DRAFT_508720 [Xylariales sp. PMI_506]